MNNSVEISVIVTAYNCARYLPEAIDSVLNQTTPVKEIILIDDGSTDNIKDIVDNYKNKITYLFKANGGIGSARNYGVTKASGDFLAFLDGDDYWSLAKLKFQSELLAKDKNLDMVFGLAQNFFSPELNDAEKKLATGPLEPALAYLAGAMLIKRDSYNKVGEFRTDLKVGEFVDWMVRAREKMLVSKYVDQIILYRRLHRSNQGVVYRKSQTDYAKIILESLKRQRKDNS